MFILNTTSQHNIEEKAAELKDLLMANEIINLSWFAKYLVIKRASIETNFHGLYLRLLAKMEIRHIFAVVTRESYIVIR